MIIAIGHPGDARQDTIWEPGTNRSWDQKWGQRGASPVEEKLATHDL